MKKILIAIMLVGALASCKKSFLDQVSATQESTEDFYKTPDDIYQALVSAYSVLDWSGYGNIWLTANLVSDDAFGGGGTSDNGLRQWDRFQDYTDLNADAWKKYYAGIYRANVMLQHVNDATFSDSATKRMYIAEAKFLRAYYYFDLVRLFGHVPLLTTPLDAGEYYVKQSSSDSVYMQIATDLKDAIPDLMSVQYSGMSTDTYGRATKWAAESLLGRVYLFYTGYYGKSDLAGLVTKSDAVTAINDVIDNSGYGLVDSFPNLWRASATEFAGQNSKEGVFNIQYTYAGLKDNSQQNGNRVQVMLGIRSQVLLPYYKGWGSSTVNPKLWDAYDASDARRTASIISIDGEGLTSQYSLGDQYQYTGYFTKKYTPLNDQKPEDLGGDFQIDNYDNYMVIRFADVLLMGAELNLSTDLAKAQTDYNLVRDRAFGNQLHRKTLTADAAGIQLIMTERRLELALEGQRYWDLLRQDPTLAVAKAAIDNISSNTDLNVTFRTETKGLMSIPQTQIGLSTGTLIQNAGWQ